MNFTAKLFNPRSTSTRRIKYLHEYHLIKVKFCKNVEQINVGIRVNDASVERRIAEDYSKRRFSINATLLPTIHCNNVSLPDADLLN